jgi:GTPase SAR1 family protein
MNNENIQMENIKILVLGLDGSGKSTIIANIRDLKVIL